MLKEPESEADIDKLIYHSRRQLGDKGHVLVWVYKQLCPKCKKSLMGKPREKGKVKIRAKEYICPSCSYTVEKKEYEERLTADIKYTCPHCGFKGEASIPYKRKNIEGIPTLRAKCGKCEGNIDITKKMKEKKGQAGMEDDD